MAEEVAALGLKVDPSGLQVGIDKLQELTEVAPQAEKALDGTATSAARASKSLATLGSGSGASLNEFAGNAKKASDSTASLGKSSESAGSAQAKFEQAIRSSLGGLNTFGDSADRAARSATALGQANTSSSAAFGVMSRAAVAAGGAITAALSVNALKNYADGWSDMRSKVGAATGDMAGAGDTMQRLVDIAQASYSPLQQTVDIYARNVSTFRDMGRSAAEAADFTESLNNMLVLTATRGQQAASVQDALAKAMAVGNLQADGLETILANAGEVAQALAKELNTNVSSLRSFASQGKITGDVIARAIIKPVDEVRQRAAEMAATITDAFGNLGTSVLSIVGQIDQATGASSSVAEAIGKISEAIKGSGDAIINFGKEAQPVFEVIAFGAATAAVALGSRLTVEAGKAGAAMAVAATQAIRLQASNIALAASAGPAALAMGALGTATRLASTAMAALGGPVGLVLTVLGTAAAAFYTFRDSSKSASDALIAMGDPIDGVIDKLTTMSEVQRRAAETSLLADQAQNVKAAEVAYNDFYTAVMNAAAASRMNSQEMQQLGDDLDKARSAGDSFIPIIERISNAKYVPAGTQQELEGLAAGFDTASQAIATAADWLAKFRDAAASTPVAGAADSSANLIKQLQAETNAMLQGATAYKSKEQAMRELKSTQDTYTAQLQKLVEAGEGASDNANRLRDAIKGIGERMTGTATSTRTAASAYDSWTNSIQQKTAALREDLNGSNKLTESQKLMIRLETELATGKLKVSAATAAKIRTDIQELAGLEKLRKETELNVRAYQEWVSLQQEMSDESVRLSKAREELQQWTFKENEALKDSARVLQVQAANIGATDKQRQLALATIQSEIQLEKELEEIRNRDVGEPEREAARIEARKRHAERMVQAETAIYISEWDKTSQTIGQTLSDYIMGGGKDAAQYLKRLFATLVLQPIVNYGVPGVMGALGMGGGGAAGGGLLGGGMNLLQTGQTLWSAFSGGMVSTLAGGISSLGGLFGSSALSTFAAGMKGSTLAAGLAGPTTAGAGGIMGAGAAFATALPWLAGGLALAGVWSSLFGRKLKDTGIGGEYDAASGFDGYTYKYYKGGLFRSNKTVRTDMDAETEAPIESAFDSVLSSISGFADALSIEASALESFKYSFEFSTNGKSEAEIQEAIAGVLNTAAIKATDSLNIDFSEFAHVGETSIETLSRLADSLTGVNTLFDALGHTLFDASLAGGDMASQLADLFGGLEGMQSVAGNYLDNYYTEQERLDIAMRGLTGSFEQLGLTLPTSKEELRKLIEAQDLTTEEGRKMYAALMMLSGSFSDVAASAENVAQKEKELADQRIAEQQRVLDEQKAAIDALYSDAGISGDTIAGILRDGLIGRITQEDVGAQISEHIVDGIYNAVAGGFADQITGILTSQIITPVLQAAAAGSLASAAVSQAAIDSVISSVSAALSALESLFNDAGFLALIDQIKGLSGSLNIGAPPVRTPTYGGGSGYSGGGSTSASNSASEREGLMRQIYQLEGNFVALRKLELDALVASNRPLQERIYALEAQQQVEQRIASLDAELLKLSGDTEAIRAKQLSDLTASLAQYMLSADQLNQVLEKQKELWDAQDAQKAQAEFDSLWKRWVQMTDETMAMEMERAALSSDMARDLYDQINAYEKLKKAITSATSTLQTEIDRLMDSITESAASTAYYEAQFAILTSQARAGDTDAAAKLPSIVQALEQAVTNGASSEDQIRSAQFGYMTSLQETQRILNEILSASGVYNAEGSGATSGEVAETPEVEIINNVSEIVMPQLVIGNNNSAELLEQVKILNEKMAKVEGNTSANVWQSKRSGDVLEEAREKGWQIQ